MKYGAVVVEGPTERDFVSDILTPYLVERGLYLVPTMVSTNRKKGIKGGVVSYDQVKFDVNLLLHDSKNVVVTTLIDFYGLAGKDFPGWDTMPSGSAYQRVEYLETEFGKAIPQRRFLPHFQLHEFEAMLFVSLAAIERNIVGFTEDMRQQLEAIIKMYDSPEEINLDNPPAKRLETILGNYNKVGEGLLIAVDIGIDTIRAQCPHFNNWLNELEALGQLPDENSG